MKKLIAFLFCAVLMMFVFPASGFAADEWVQTGSGSIEYANFPSGFDQSHDIYRTYNKQPVTAYETATTKRTVTNTRISYIYWHWTYEPGSPTSSVDNRFIQSYRGYDPVTRYNFNYFHAAVNNQNYTFYPYANAYQWNGGGIYWTYWWYRLDLNRCDYVDYAKNTTTSFTVTFLDWNNTVLKTQTVEKGKDATPPANPYREGYTFTGWDKWFINVQSDLVVTAKYTENAKNIFTVTFRDWNGATLKTQAVEQGKSATPPPNPYREGYTFTGWDKSFANVQSNLAVTAQYSENAKSSFTVTFRDWNNTALKTQTVEKGKAATPPANPYRDGYKFTGWDKSYTNVQSDLTITAQYEKITVSDPFTMGEDNYKFINTRSSFGYSSPYSIPLARFREIYSPTDAEYYYGVFAPWGGNCYGFAASSYALEVYKLNPGNYQSGVTKTYNFSTPGTPGSLVTQLIELYQIAQMLPEPLTEEYGSNYDNLSALVNTVNNEDGLIVILKGTAGGHAVIAYGKESLGGTRYSLKIYDNNQPDNTNLRIEVDTSKSGNAGWYFNAADTQQYNSRLHGNISFISGETVNNAIEKARRANYSDGNIRILASPGSQIVNSAGQNIEDVEGAFRFIPNAVLADDTSTVWDPEFDLWFVPDDVYTIDLPEGAASTATLFNANEAFEVAVDDGSASVEFMLGRNSYANIIALDAKSSVEMSYATNETISAPARIRGGRGSRFNATVTDNGKVYISGDMEITVISGAENIETTETPNRPAKTITIQIGSPYMYVDGVRKEIYPGENASAVLINDRTLVPIRAIAEELGARVEWDESAQAVIIRQNNTTIVLRINNTRVDVNERSIQSEVAPQLIDNRTMIPLRIVAEALNCQVNWDQPTKTVTIIG